MDMARQHLCGWPLRILMSLALDLVKRGKPLLTSRNIEEGAVFYLRCLVVLKPPSSRPARDLSPWCCGRGACVVSEAIEREPPGHSDRLVSQMRPIAIASAGRSIPAVVGRRPPSFP